MRKVHRSCLLKNWNTDLILSSYCNTTFSDELQKIHAHYLLDSHNYFLGCTGQALSSLFTFVKTEAQ